MSFTTAQRALQRLSNRFLGLTIPGIRTGGHYCSYALDAGTQDEAQLSSDQPTQSLLMTSSATTTDTSTVGASGGAHRRFRDEQTDQNRLELSRTYSTPSYGTSASFLVADPGTGLGNFDCQPDYPGQCPERRDCC